MNMLEHTQNRITIAITGAAGQLGRHCSARLSYHYGYNVIDIDRNLFSDFDALASSLEKADVVLHLAGVNRGDDETCLLYTSPSPRDKRQSRMPSSA